MCSMSVRAHAIFVALLAALSSGCSVPTVVPVTAPVPLSNPAASAAPGLTVSAIEVHAARPTTADLQRLRYVDRTNDRDVVYIVTLDVNETEPFFTSLGIQLFVGNSQVDEYAGFSDGIYFKVFDPGFFTTSAGEEIRFTVDGKTFYGSGIHVPELPAATRQEVAELPSQSDILGTQHNAGFE